SSASQVRLADFDANYFAGTGPGFLACLAVGLLSVLAIGLMGTVVRGPASVPGSARVLASGLIFGLSLVLYTAWDPRSHALLLAPVLTEEWQLDLPELSGGFCPPGRQELPFSLVRFLYPPVNAPDRAFFSSDEVSVGFWGVDVRYGLSRWPGIG